MWRRSLFGRTLQGLSGWVRRRPSNPQRDDDEEFAMFRRAAQNRRTPVVSLTALQER
jgi:hypothetical protein